MVMMGGFIFASVPERSKPKADAGVEAEIRQVLQALILMSDREIEPGIAADLVAQAEGKLRAKEKRAAAAVPIFPAQDLIRIGSLIAGERLSVEGDRVAQEPEQPGPAGDKPFVTEGITRNSRTAQVILSLAIEEPSFPARIHGRAEDSVD